MKANSGFAGELKAQRIVAPSIARVRELRTPFGRVGFTRDKGDGRFGFGTTTMFSNLTASIFRADGKLLDVVDCGSGLVTNTGVNCLVNDVLGWAIAPAIKLFNYHASGTGATAAAVGDVWLQTATGSGSLTGSTNGYFTGAQSLVAPDAYKTIATSVYSASISVTEWILAMSNAAPFTGRSFTSTGANVGTDSGASFTTAGNGLMGWTVESNATVTNATSTTFGTVTANTGTALTLGVTSAGGWFTNNTNATASTPGGTSAYVVYPTILDHKVFSTISVNSGDSIQWTYTNTYTSGS